MKRKILAIAEAAFFQCAFIDSKGSTRRISVYACGTDVYWANDFFDLFDKDKCRAAEQWFKQQLSEQTRDIRLLNWRGTDATGELAVQEPTATPETVFSTESSIPQAEV